MYAKKGLRHILLITFITAFASILGYATRILYAKYLTPTQYGLFYSIFAFVGLFGILKQGIFSNVLERYIPKFLTEGKIEAIASMIRIIIIIKILIALIVSLVLFGFSDFLSQHFFNNVLASNIIILILGFFFFSTFLDTIESIFIGFQKPLYFSLLTFLRIFFVLLISTLFFIYGFELISPALAYFFMSLIMLPISFFIFIKIFPEFFRYKFSIDLSHFKYFLSFGASVFLSGFAHMLISRTDTLMLTFFRSLKDVGVYNVAYPTASLLLFFSGAFNIVLYPLSSELISKKKIEDLKEIVRLYHLSLFVFAIPIVCLFLVFPKEIINFGFGKDFNVGFIALRILSIAFFIFIVSNINIIVLNCLGKSWRVTRIFIFAALLNIVLNFILIPIIGISGASLATLLSFIFIIFSTSLMLKKYINYFPPILKSLKIFFCGGVFLVTAVFLKINLTFALFTKLLIIGSVCFLIYSLLIFYFKIINFKAFVKLIRKT